MKIKYYTSIPDKDSSETKLWKVLIALRESKLPFICDTEYNYGSWHVTVELKYNVFDSWNDMEEYCRKFVVAFNKGLHAESDLARLDEKLNQLILEGKSNG